MQTVYLICGVPASGKSWICEQLIGKYAYLPHDLHYEDHIEATTSLAKHSSMPVITECPFGERITKEKLEANGCQVIPLFVVEPTSVVRRRFEERERRELPKNVATRSVTILERAMEWNAKHGTSEEILKLLKELV